MPAARSSLDSRPAARLRCARQTAGARRLLGCRGDPGQLGRAVDVLWGAVGEDERPQRAKTGAKRDENRRPDSRKTR